MRRVAQIKRCMPRGKRRLLLRTDGNRVKISDRCTARIEFSSRDKWSVRFQLTVPGKLQRIREGALNVTASHGTLVAIMSMDREIVVATIVASEMPVDAPFETLKAQAARRAYKLLGADRAS